jgi:hypothetical protein
MQQSRQGTSLNNLAFKISLFFVFVMWLASHFVFHMEIVLREAYGLIENWM